MGDGKAHLATRVIGHKAHRIDRCNGWSGGDDETKASQRLRGDAFFQMEEQRLEICELAFANVSTGELTACR